jgi:Flp pilus assembly protein TadB
MSASNQFVMDSRVPVSPSADKDDPSHPENVTKRAIMLQRQAHADAAQDIKAPIRNAPEPFETQETSTASPHRPSLLFLLLAILVGSVLIGVAVCYKLHLLYRFALAIGAMCAFRYAASVVQEPTAP